MELCARYFGKFNKFRNDHWAFGDAASGAYLIKFSWTDIVRQISWSPVERPLTIASWSSTGSFGADASNPRCQNTRCACSPGRMAVSCSCRGRAALRRSATS